MSTTTKTITVTTGHSPQTIIDGYGNTTTGYKGSTSFTFTNGKIESVSASTTDKSARVTTSVNDSTITVTVSSLDYGKNYSCNVVINYDASYKNYKIRITNSDGTSEVKTIAISNAPGRYKAVVVRKNGTTIQSSTFDIKGSNSAQTVTFKFYYTNSKYDTVSFTLPVNGLVAPTIKLYVDLFELQYESWYELSGSIKNNNNYPVRCKLILYEDGGAEYGRSSGIINANSSVDPNTIYNPQLTNNNVKVTLSFYSEDGNIYLGQSYDYTFGNYSEDTTTTTVE